MKSILQFEIKQLLRDKKTLIFLFVIPLIIFPLINGGFSFLAKKQINKVLHDSLRVAMEENNLVSSFSDSLRAANISYDLFSKIDSTSVDTLLKKYPVVVTFEKNDTTSLVTALVTYSSKKDKNSMKASKLIRMLKKVKTNEIEKRYALAGINNYYEVKEVKLSNQASEIKTDNYNNSKSLPITLLIVLFIGTFIVANYVILGEKDNKTLETLLTSGASRMEIVKGKMIIVLSAGIIMAILEMLSFYLYILFSDFGGVKLHLSLPALLLILLVALSACILAASFNTFVSSKFKSSSMGQAYSMPLTLVVSLLAFAGVFDGISLEKGLLLLPILAPAGMIKNLIIGTYSYNSLAVVILANLFYALIFIRKTVSFLNSENVLDRENDGFLDDNKRSNLNYSLLAFGFVLLIYYFLGGYLQQKEIISGLIFSQILILGIASYLIVGFKFPKENKKDLYSFKKANYSYFIYAIILGLFARMPISYFKIGFLWLFPLPKIFTENNVLTSFNDLNIVYFVLIVALLPAIFEELLFRGSFLAIIKRGRSDLAASVIVGIMFGLMHLNFYTLLETSMLGIIMTWLCLKSGSIFPAMLTHFVNNATSVLLSKIPDYASIDMAFLEKVLNSHWLLGGGSVLTVITIYLIYLKDKKENHF